MFKLTLALLLATLSLSAQGFGPIGHRVVARLAENQLSEATKNKISSLLAGETLPMVSTWADEVRSDKNFSHTSNWHYINVASNKKIKLANVEGQAWKVLNEQITLLRSKKSNEEQKAQALKWIVHIVGDLHQPLHAGLSEDRGGNQIELPWFGKQSNLHEIWDSELLRFRELSFSEQAEFLQHKINSAHQQLAKEPIEKWLAEDVALRELVYSYPKRAQMKWEYDYIYRTKNVLDEQLIKAGLRLAHILEESFK